eukprot:3273961-Alexandrium_andersonii.AAC.1
MPAHLRRFAKALEPEPEATEMDTGEAAEEPSSISSKQAASVSKAIAALKGIPGTELHQEQLSKLISSDEEASSKLPAKQASAALQQALRHQERCAKHLAQTEAR